MNEICLVGFDPGLVHTGGVLFIFDKKQKLLLVEHEVIVGPDVTRAQQWLGGVKADVFIEDYKPRSHYGTDKRMTQAVSDFRKGFPGSTVLNNTGVKKVVKEDLMRLLHCWKFSTSTNHQDLRSAARIALLGGFRTPHINEVISDVVKAHLDGNDWTITARS